MIRRAQQTYKHQVDLLATGVNMSTAINSTTIAIATDNPLIGATSSVQPRSRILKMYFEITFTTTVASPSSQVFHWNLQFSPQNSIAGIDPTASGAQTGKNYVFKTGTIQATNNAPAKSFGWVKIPLKYSRFMNQDTIVFNYRTTFNNVATDNLILKCIYQEIRG